MLASNMSGITMGQISLVSRSSTPTQKMVLGFPQREATSSQYTANDATSPFCWDVFSAAKIMINMNLVYNT